MSKVYAICTIGGLIRFTEGAPDEGQFALAVGELEVVRQVVRATATPASAPERAIAWRVPGTDDNAPARANLGAIARYIQQLSVRDVPGFRALGV
nr:hypothetical protein [Pseudomonas chengduensis]